MFPNCWRPPCTRPADRDCSLGAGQSTVVDGNTIGFPRALAELPDGDYYAQAVVNVYEQVHRADGKAIWVHVNDGTVEFFTVAPGNLYSTPQLVHVTRDGTIAITGDHVVPPATRPADTEWLEHVGIQSDMLTKFWGRPIFVHAHVLLPNGYGDAIVREVIPCLDQHFRIIRKPYARQLEGASTSGWQNLAMQLQHPDFFGGA